MKTYCYQIPGMFYAGHAYGNNEKEARVWLREYLNIARLPRGTAIWEWRS